MNTSAIELNKLMITCGTTTYNAGFKQEDFLDFLDSGMFVPLGSAISVQINISECVSILRLTTRVGF